MTSGTDLKDLGHVRDNCSIEIRSIGTAVLELNYYIRIVFALLLKLITEELFPQI